MMLCLFASGYFVTGPVMLPERAEQVVASLRTADLTDKPLLVVADKRLASRIRLLMGRSDSVVYAPDLSRAQEFTVVLVSDTDAATLAGQGYQLKAVAKSSGVPKLAQVWNGLRERRLLQVLLDSGRTYYFAMQH